MAYMARMTRISKGLVVRYKLRMRECSACLYRDLQTVLTIDLSSFRSRIGMSTWQQILQRITVPEGNQTTNEVQRSEPEQTPMRRKARRCQSLAA